MNMLVFVYLICLVTLGMHNVQSERADTLDLLRRVLESMESREVKCPDRSLKIGSFNIQIFGDTKYEKKNVVEILIKILKRYDIVLVMEIRDASGDSFPKLVKDIISDSGINYAYEISERMGDSWSKEQYAFLYRPDIFKALKIHTYTDPTNEYERPPYGVMFQTQCADIEKFVLGGIHTSPKDAKKEINHLTKVYEEFEEEFETKDIVIMGDYNGACSYVKDSDWDDISFRTDPRFKWFILDDMDTTVSKGECAYDRIVAGGSDLIKSISPDVSIYYFDKEYKLDEELAKDVSDHYPVEFELYKKGGRKDGMDIYRAVEFDSPINQDRVSDIKKTILSKPDSDFIIILSDEDQLELVKEAYGITNVLKDLKKLNEDFPHLITDELLNKIEAYDLKSEFLQSYKSKFLVDIKFLRQTCEITIKNKYE